MSKYDEFVNELNDMWDKKKDDFVVVRGYINAKGDCNRQTNYTS